VARIGVLGGTFNPIHIAHLAVAEELCEEADLREVIFVPARCPPHKDGDIIPDGRLRLEMVELAVRDNPRFRVSDLELRRDGPSYTVDTVAALSRELGPECEICLIMGADSLREIASWKEPERILRTCTLLVGTRPGVELGEIPQLLAARTRVVPVTELAVSSREIRARVRQGRSVRYLVPDPVREYIQSRGLYRE
jgi:nicotinate-nucleotide adenylyltransferase